MRNAFWIHCMAMLLCMFPAGAAVSQDAEETEQLPARRNRKDDQHRVKPNAIADKLGRQDRALDRLCYRERRDNADQFPQRLGFERDSQCGQPDPEYESEIRHKTDEPRNHADRDRELEAHKPQTNRVDDRKRKHDKQLAAQERAEHVVGILRETNDRVVLRGRNQGSQVGENRVPVTKQVKSKDRYEKQAENCGQHCASGLRQPK